MTDEEYLAWRIKEHGSWTSIDWRKEYQRIVTVLGQALPSIHRGEQNAATLLLDIAHDIGQKLLEETE